MLIPEAQILVSSLLWLAVSEIKVHLKWPELKLGGQKLYTCTLNISPRGPKFGPFCYTTSCFQDKRSKIRNALNDPKLEHLTVKSTLFMYTKYLPLRPEYWSILLYDQWFSSGLEMHRMTPNWTWKLDSQKYSIVASQPLDSLEGADLSWVRPCE